MKTVTLPFLRPAMLPFAIFQFFILLAITLATNKLARATASFDA